MKEITGDCPLGAKCEEVKEIAGEQCLVRCPWLAKVQGKNPQSEEIFDEWRCGIQWMPMLLVENSQHQRQTGAAVESFRNEMVKQNGRLLAQYEKQSQLPPSD